LYTNSFGGTENRVGGRRTIEVECPPLARIMLNSERDYPFITNVISFTDIGNTKCTFNMAKEITAVPKFICNVTKPDFCILKT
jgi:hypothetical protein